MAKAQDDDWRLINKPQGEGRFHPTREGRINDSSPRDSGNNMGRIARTGVWDVEIARLMREERISSIPIAAWQAFLGSFHESTTLDDALLSIPRSCASLRNRFAGSPCRCPTRIAGGLSELEELMRHTKDRGTYARRQTRR